MPTVREPLACARATEDESASSESSESRVDFDMFRGEAMVVVGYGVSNGDLVKSEDGPRWGQPQPDGQARAPIKGTGSNSRGFGFSRYASRVRGANGVCPSQRSAAMSRCCARLETSRLQAMHAFMTGWGRVIARGGSALVRRLKTFRGTHMP